MTVEQIEEKLKTKEYNFLREDNHLGSNVIILTLGGEEIYRDSKK